ncbi:SixA phosphatase family protein [Plantactinospora sp. GCM10030261]|uniref:SixA phosphatase family protein n=1 Tax=Plantactinospora sp. GCM10030261 TaxID=3273420 RepID=UPI00360D256D
MTERRIVLLRHAKAEQPEGVADAERPLATRGHADAAAAGAWLEHSGYRPTEVICSPAKRTRQTWHEVALGMTAPLAGHRPELTPHGDDRSARTPDASDRSAPGRSSAIEPPHVPGLGPTVRYEEGVYRDRAENLLELLRGADPDSTTVLLIGHNPSISKLSILLDPVHADPEGLRTAGLAVHGFTGRWTDLAPGGAALERWFTARG